MAKSKKSGIVKNGLIDFSNEKGQEIFLEQYNISKDTFNASGQTWENLLEIKAHYKSLKTKLKRTISREVVKIKEQKEAHSISFRIKNADHLIEKIIRKNPKVMKNGGFITVDNYLDYITDILGIRILMLYKEDWVNIHRYLMKQYVGNFNEPPFIYVRKGDRTDIYKKEGMIIKDEKAYRSAHYVVKTKNNICIEFQVRTLFDEAWGEIDHNLRYPYNLDNPVINQNLEILNRISGIGDEMGSFLKQYIDMSKKEGAQKIFTGDDAYQKILELAESCSDEDVKDSIKTIVNQAITIDNMNKMAELLDTFSSDLK